MLNTKNVQSSPGLRYRNFDIIYVNALKKTLRNLTIMNREMLSDSQGHAKLKFHFFRIMSQQCQL